jgi:uncharacterized protein YuzE
MEKMTDFIESIPFLLKMPSKRMWVDYDEEADVLYISFKKPQFMGEITAGRIIFGPENVEPILGVEALESVGIIVDPKKRTLRRLPAIPLK